ncbi:PREDICTED: uncharacterized protein LOC109461637 [Branchiostoma belcheri]|uniref:Uncharacterized protein LOC109461637 n=1 Tax=Branchiostoma belcheri TaxID=7741 RepID=A0A6P4Y9W2_BRABE|nr:PREDICTED: uncharacterized protein LOC109461637 [Branchiostoma belcheri]XP_019613577.1 PREDICTED: uncharacterized protein LOC109461637 [Branchiostoma belcheri]
MPVTRSGSQQGRGRGGRALGRGGPTQRGGRGGRGRGGPTTDQPEDIVNLRTELQRLQAANELLSKELESRPPAPQGAPTLPTTTQFGPTPPALPPAQLDGPANALAGAILDRPLPPHIPSHGAMPNSGTLPSTAVVLNKVANDLLMTSLAPSTLRAYRSAWQQLRQFTFQLVGRDLTMPPISVPLLSQFIASLHQRQIAPASISSKLSAISFIHKLFDLPDPTQSFVIQKLMQAIRKFRVPDDRLPISPFILKSLVDSLQNTTATHYDQALFKAMYLFTYYSMARIGEVAVTSGPQHTLQLSNISLFPSRQTSGPSIIATFQSFKHNSSGRPSSISIQSQPGSRYCPVASLQDYLKLRGNCAGCLFLRSNGRPVSADLFARTLKTSLEHLGLDTHKITPHSFRIGAATWAAMQGVPDSLLRSLGRWSSDAFKHYIRL